jgi:pimeloyl-ACP methyl ester carboxylesterase
MTAVELADQVPPVGDGFGLAEPWGGQSRLAELNGPTHWVDFGGPAGGPPFVLVHGLGGSHLNWLRIAPELAQRRRTVAIDLAGFGLTRPAGRSSSVPANTGLLDRFLDLLDAGPAILVGNSMGGMIALRQAASRPASVAGLVLLDPSLPVPGLHRHRPDPLVALRFALFATPVLGGQLLARSRQRMTDRQLVDRVLGLCLVDPSVLPEQVLDAAIRLAGIRRRFPEADSAFLDAARSLIRVLANPIRYRQLIARVQAPVLLIHGERDRLVPVAAARTVAAARPDWQSVLLPEIGHTPQLECPELMLDQLTGWLRRHELAD